MPGQQQHVDGVQPGDEDLAGELAAEDEEAQVGADHRDRQDDARRDPQAGAGEQVVGQGVAGEALDDRQQREVDPITQLSSRGLRNAPVKNTRNMCTTVAADEDQRRPVVDLAHEQAAAHVERQPSGRGVRLGHRLVAERR